MVQDTGLEPVTFTMSRYRSIIEQYLDAPSAGIIADIHQPLALFKGAVIPEVKK